MKTSPRIAFASGFVVCLIALLVMFSKRDIHQTAKDTPVIHAKPALVEETSIPEKAIVLPPDDAAASAASADEILKLLSSGNPLDQSKVYRELLPAFVRRNPRAAGAFAQSPEAAQWHDDLMVTVAQTWTDMNVDAAEKWATQLPNLTERSMVLGDVCFEEARIDPERAMRVLDNGEVNSMRREIIVENLAQQWASGDLSPLYNQVDKLPPGTERDGLFKRVALAQSQSDPSLAAQMIVDKIAPGPTQIEAVMYVLRQWAKQDMAGAEQWVNQFPAGELHDQAKSVLAGNLYGSFQPPSLN